MTKVNKDLEITVGPGTEVGPEVMIGIGIIIEVSQDQDQETGIRPEIMFQENSLMLTQQEAGLITGIAALISPTDTLLKVKEEVGIEATLLTETVAIVGAGILLGIEIGEIILGIVGNIGLGLPLPTGKTKMAPMKMLGVSIVVDRDISTVPAPNYGKT